MILDLRDSPSEKNVIPVSQRQNAKTVSDTIPPNFVLLTSDPSIFRFTYAEKTSS